MWVKMAVTLHLLDLCEVQRKRAIDPLQQVLLADKVGFCSHDAQASTGCELIHVHVVHTDFLQRFH